MEIVEIKTIRIGEFFNICYVQLITNEELIGLGETFFNAEAVESWIHGSAVPILLG